MYWQPDGSDPHVIGEVHSAKDVARLVQKAKQDLLDQGGKLLWQPHEYCAIVRLDSVDWYIYEASCGDSDKVQKQSGKMRRA